jgi:anti-sigma B factor antagonist
MTTPLTLTVDHVPDGGVVLKAVGEIDMTNTADLVDALGQNPGHVVVDLTDVAYLDSAGLGVLFTHASHIEVIGNVLLEPVLTISGLAALITVRSAEKADG